MSLGYLHVYSVTRCDRCNNGRRDSCSTVAVIGCRNAAWCNHRHRINSNIKRLIVI